MSIRLDSNIGRINKRNGMTAARPRSTRAPSGGENSPPPEAPDKPRASGYPTEAEAPDEFQWFDTTHREGTLSDLRNGPDHRWTTNVRQAPAESPLGETLPGEAQETWEQMQKLHGLGVLEPLAHASRPLQVLACQHVLQECLKGNPPDVPGP